MQVFRYPDGSFPLATRGLSAGAGGGAARLFRRMSLSLRRFSHHNHKNQSKDDHSQQPLGAIREKSAFQGCQPQVQQRQLLRHHRCQRDGQIDAAQGHSWRARLDDGQCRDGSGRAYVGAVAGPLQVGCLHGARHGADGTLGAVEDNEGARGALCQGRVHRRGRHEGFGA